MSDAIYTVTFRSALPDPLKVGDEIRLAGKTTVRAIEAQLVDISGYASEGSEVALGDITVQLVGNTLQVVQ